MGNCCSTQSDQTGLIPNEQFEFEITTYDKDFDHSIKPKKRHFKFSGTSLTSKKKSGSKDIRNPATGEKKTSGGATPSPSISRTNLDDIGTNNNLDTEFVGYGNPSFEPSTPIDELEDKTLATEVKTEENVPETIEGLIHDSEILEQTITGSGKGTTQDSENQNENVAEEVKDTIITLSVRNEPQVVMRRDNIMDSVHKGIRPTSLPVGLPTLKEDSTEMPPLLTPGMRKPSGSLKLKQKRGYANLPLLEFKKLLKDTPSYENEFSPIVSDLLLIKNCSYIFNLYDLEDVDGPNYLGSGGFGVVSKMKHIPSGFIMAIKRVQIRVDAGLQRELAALDDGRKRGSPYIVEYYGSIKHNGEVWIAMELMKESMDKIKITVYDIRKQNIPEHIIKHVSFSICAALNFLKKELKIIHRDVKPSNMLVGEDGSVKICDFGIAGPLIESRAKSKEIGCRPYMAPERLDPNITNYTVQVDVWSFGISIMELMTGVFPYESKFSSYFEQWNEIVLGEPPQVESNGRYSEGLLAFINPCLSKDIKDRPTFDKLLHHDFLNHYDLDSSKKATREWLAQMNI